MRIALILVAACGGAAAPPPVAPVADPPPVAAPANDIAAQAALTEQYDIGKKLYTSKKCASCHGDHGEGNPKNPAVIGEGSLPAQPPAGAKLRKVTFTTAADVLAFVRTKMPLAEPGTLTNEEAAAVTSWMLSESKIDFSVPLDTTTARTIKLR